MIPSRAPHWRRGLKFILTAARANDKRMLVLRAQIFMRAPQKARRKSSEMSSASFAAVGGARPAENFDGIVRARPLAAMLPKIPFSIRLQSAFGLHA